MLRRSRHPPAGAGRPAVLTRIEAEEQAASSRRTRVLLFGAGHVGKAIATALARAGYDLLITARTATALETLATQLARETGQRVEYRHGDLRDPELPESLIEAAVDAFGGLDLLVNNAGATKRGPFLELSEDDWQDGFALKFFGAVRLSRVAWPYLKLSGGQVINIIGAGGRTPTAEFTIGGSVNAGLMNFTKALADQGLADGVRVNGINPGPILTERLTGRIRQISHAQGSIRRRRPAAWCRRRRSCGSASRKRSPTWLPSWPPVADLHPRSTAGRRRRFDQGAVT